MSIINRISYRGNTSKFAEKIARQYNLELVEDPDKFDDLVIISEQKISLKLQGLHDEFYIDFFNNYYRYRLLQGKKEALLKACGVKRDVHPSILDLTGGWGRDGYILASSGCEVLILEREPIIYLLLDDGIRRLKKKMNCNISVINTESFDYLQNNIIESEVIYFDPMRPNDKQKAKNKKEIEILRKIIINNNEYPELPEVAYKKASSRLVVKSGCYQALNTNLVPTYTVMGKNTKFDVYCKK